MKTLINILALSAALAGLAFSNTACKSGGGGAERTALNATSTAIATADTAMQAWSEYVVKREAAIAKLKLTDPDKAASESHQLLLNEGKVSAAFENYQNAARLAVTTGANASGTNSPALAIASAAGPLIALITSLTQN